MAPWSSFHFNAVSIKFILVILQIPREMQFLFFPLNVIVTTLIIASINSIINSQIRHEVILNLKEGINIFIMYYIFTSAPVLFYWTVSDTGISINYGDFISFLPI